MNIVIMGCNGIAVNVAEKMAKNDHKITIIDVQADNFLIIEETENITTIIGDGTISNELEGAGIITDIGENVKDFKVGDKISYAGIPLGSYCSHRNYPTKNLQARTK